MFFLKKNQGSGTVKGAVGISLVTDAAIAVDRNYLPLGNVVFAKTPHSDRDGNFTHEYVPRVLSALDVCGAIRHNHFYLYMVPAMMLALRLVFISAKEKLGN